MKLDSKVLTTQLQGLGLDERVQFLCARARELEEVGEFDSAQEMISDFWQRVGDPPKLDGLEELSQAELLLRAGTLSGWIGSARQLPGAQETAKDLISAAARIFEANGAKERVAEAGIDLAICYIRQGAFDEAGVTIADALQQLGSIESEQRLRASLNRAIVEKMLHRYDAALQTHIEAAPLFEKSSNNALKGKFHNEYAAVLKNLGLAQNRTDYVDQALVEYAAASFYAEQAGHRRFLALVENNVGLLLARLGRFADAQSHLDRSRSLFAALKDGMVALVDDTRARVFIMEGQYGKAEMLARASARVLEQGDELSVLAITLTTHGTALARLGNYAKAKATFERAIRTAHDAGDPESAGVAALSMSEELISYLPFSELSSYYRIADTELLNSQREEIQSRLNKCARQLLTLTSSSDAPLPRQVPEVISETETESDVPADATLEEQVRAYEGVLIKNALEVSQGSVTRAARILGITHQGLAFILNGRHKDLLPARKPVKKRRRSIIRFH